MRREAVLTCMSIATGTGLELCRAPSGSEGPAVMRWARSAAKLDAVSLGGLWNTDQYSLELANSRSDVLGVWDGPELLAFACTSDIVDETHLLSLAVRPDWQRRSLARVLMLSCMWSACSASQALFTLEVRQANQPAVGLYQACGLRQVGVRPRYYQQPTDDAVILTCEFEPGCEALDEQIRAAFAARPQYERAVRNAAERNADAADEVLLGAL